MNASSSKPAHLATTYSAATSFLQDDKRVPHRLAHSRLGRVRPWRRTYVIEAICWWDLREVLPGRVHPVDAHPARLTRLPL
ncbi:hypothetical protein [Streptomyces azureus]|uniref:Putative RNA pyrophosphohydrolase n=1 Tax=Streptomyces azureus TaxID=146537 RepID=A0A0K8PK44_STRAJ|nr:hypothetical protein [Streptomyces azureus]GAP48246.1 putative RNA pyrophosphohydrolase [Streptomyces azureus]